MTVVVATHATDRFCDQAYPWPSEVHAPARHPPLRLPRGDTGDRSHTLDRSHTSPAAEAHFRTGLEWCERERCPVEAGRCHQGLAEVAERRGDHALAMQHLDAAGELFSRHGAKLYLDQVLAKKEILRA
jgi:hypothetical protein